MKRKLPNTLPRISPIPAGDDTAELIHTLERFAREANDQRSDQTGEVRPAYDGREVRAPVLGRVRQANSGDPNGGGRPPATPRSPGDQANSGDPNGGGRGPGLSFPGAARVRSPGDQANSGDPNGGGRLPVRPLATALEGGAGAAAPVTTDLQPTATAAPEGAGGATAPGLNPETTAAPSNDTGVPQAA